MKILLTILLPFFSIAIFAQTITLSQDTVVLRPGAIIDYNTYVITNNSNDSLELDCTVRPICYNPQDTSSAVVICFGINCFQPVSEETTYGEKLNGLPVAEIAAGESDESFKLEVISDGNYGSRWAVEFFDQENPSDKATLIVYYSSCSDPVSVSNNYEKVNFTASPNPANDWLNLTFEEGNVQRVLNIYNTIGQLQDSEILSATEFTHRKDISKLKTGTYFLQVISDDGTTAVKKLVVR